MQKTAHNVKMESPIGKKVEIILSTSEKMKILLDRDGHNQKWLAEKWGISQPSMSQKFRENNWKESDIQKFCDIMSLSYEVTFTDVEGKKL